MDIRSFVAATAFFFIVMSFESAGEGKLGRLIKEQQNNDSTSFQESKIEKKGCFF